MQGEGHFRVSREQADAAADFLKGMANANRLMILARLARSEASVGEIETELGIRQPSLSQQLGALREAGLVEARREAKQVFYQLASEKAEQIFCLLEHVLGQPRPERRAAHKGPTAPAATGYGSGAAMFARVIPFSGEGG